MLKLLLIAAALNHTAADQSTFRLVCTERQHGECSSDSICKKHPSKDAVIKITLPEIVRVREAQGTVQKCLAGSCGNAVIVDAHQVDGGGWMLRHYPADSMAVDGRTGVYTQATLNSQPTGASVAFAFGTCKRN